MTIQNQDSSVTHNGNSATTEWPFTFEIPDADSLKVGLFDIATNVLTELTNTVYSVIGLGDPNGGEVTYPLVGLPITSAKRLVIWREVALTQDMDVTNQSPYYPEVLEDQLDLIVMMAQQLNEEIGRAVRVPQGADATDLDILIAGILALSPINTDIQTVAGISGQVVVVSGLSAEITTVAGNAAHIVTVSGISSDVTAVAGIGSDVTTVVGLADEIAALALISGQITTVAGIQADVTAVSAMAADISAVVGNAANINVVAANASNINLVAANETNINAVAANETNIDTAVANMPAIVDAPNQASAAADSALEAAGYAAMVNFWKGTQVAYDAIAVKDPDRLYFITA